MNYGLIKLKLSIWKGSKYVLIFHVAKKEQWNQSLKDGFYGDFSLKKDGFIHCSKFNQLLHVANNNLKNVDEELIILCIDIDNLNSEIKWEKNANNNMFFPHIYGLINVSSVIDTLEFKKNALDDFFISDEISNYENFEKSCGAVVFHKFDEEYKVLLINFIHDDKSRWGFPKRHVEGKETEIQTAIREIKEEVGLDVEIISKFRAQTHFSLKKGTTSEAVYYCARTIDIATTIQKGEVEKTQWFNFEEAYEHLTFDCDKEILTKFIKFFREFQENH